MNTEAKKYEVEDYMLRSVREKIIGYRKEKKFLGNLMVSLPVDAETSLHYLQEHYADVSFQLSLDLNFRELLVEPAKVEAQAKTP